VPGGFGQRAIDGKIATIKYVRENNIPFLGICLGMQLATIEFARNVCGLKSATSAEMDRNSKTQLILEIKTAHTNNNLGGTLRLGSYNCHLKAGSLARKLYKKADITERHRHRYEFNNKYRSILEERGLVFSGINPEADLVEIIEIPNHPFFIAGQFHPELKSRPTLPHPLFVGLIKAIT